MNFEDKEISNHRLEPEGGVLYVVGTPIGHLGDLSPRAESILRSVSAIACEDTRHSGKLLKRVGAKAPLFSFYEHNTQSRLSQFLELLQNGDSLALISDAGLPGISDPGEKLVKAARESGHDVICIPGPCAATTALVSSGLPCHRFCFEGFLPSKGNGRKKILIQIAKETRTTVIYEAPHRLIKLLKELVEVCGEQRPLQVSRELTKRHEEHIGATTGAALRYFTTQKPIGEFTLVLGGAPEEKSPLYTNSELIDEMKELINNGSSATEAARNVAKKSSYSRRFLYSLLHQTNIRHDS